MCSSPKSSASPAAKVRVKGYYEEMSQDKRDRFTNVANRADEQRAKRAEIHKRWEAKHKSAPKRAGPFTWLGKLLSGN